MLFSFHIQDQETQADTRNRGQTLTIDVAGTLKEDIEKGAYVELQVKYGLIRLVSTKADLCEQVSNVDLECPIQKGKAVITKDVDLPKEIPPVSSISLPSHLMMLISVGKIHRLC